MGTKPYLLIFNLFDLHMESNSWISDGTCALNIDNIEQSTIALAACGIAWLN